MSKFDEVASNILNVAYRRGGCFNQYPIGYGFEELTPFERCKTVNILDKYGNTIECLPGSFIFNRFELNKKGIELHEQYGSYIDYLKTKEQERKDKEIARMVNLSTLETNKKAIELSEEANRLSKEANNHSSQALDISKEGNEIAHDANRLSCWAIIISGLSILVSIVCAFKDTIYQYFHH